MDVSDSVTDSSFTVDVRARRRKLHTEAEQRRRDAIKRGFDSLLELIPPAKTGSTNSHFRMSKATVLNRSISMILKASKIQTQKRLEIETLRKKVQALQILKAQVSLLLSHFCRSYERMSNTTTYATETHDTAITDQYKLRLFQMFMEKLFFSFDSNVSALSLPELSDQIITWLEISCKPESLHQIMEDLLDPAVNEAYDLPHHQQHLQRPAAQQHQAKNAMYEVHKATECLGQLIPAHQRTPNAYHRPSLKLSSSLEAVHESPFPIPDSLSSDQGVVHLSDRYQQPNCPRPIFNTSFDPHPVYSEPSQQNYVRPQHHSVFPMRSYQPLEDPSLPNTFSSTATIPTTQRHSSSPSSTVAMSSVFQRSSVAGSNATARNLVVDSTLPAPLFPPAPLFVSPDSFLPPQIQYPGSSGGCMPLPDEPFSKQSPF